MEIELTQGKTAIVDDQDAELAKYKWQYNDTNRNGNGYAIRSTSKRIYMHRVIVGAGDGELVHHINGDHLDNRRENLEIITNSQRAIRSNSNVGSSGYRGVHAVSSGVYKVAITAHGKTIHVGTFDDAVTAAKMYDAAARKHFGAHAYLNFPDEEPVDDLERALHDNRRRRLKRAFEAGKRSSPYVGVSTYSGGRFRAVIQKDGKQVFLGGFDTAKAAALAYDRAAVEIHGNDTFVNFP